MLYQMVQISVLLQRATGIKYDISKIKVAGPEIGLVALKRLLENFIQNC